MDQEIREISIQDLVLWTENPRDPIDEDAVDQDIVDRALNDKLSKWTLAKLAKEMGDFYDYSELPTVVYHGKKPIVYDGNRRIVLGKIKHGLVSIPDDVNIQIPDFPELIPCNVCVKEIALVNVFRKHSDTGSWQPLERDFFLYKFMGEEKSIFLVLDEATGIVRKNPHMNQRFVKEEIFREDILKSLGFSVKSGNLFSAHNTEEGHLILSDVAKKVKLKDITTRKNRGKVKEVLEPSSQQIIDQNKAKKHQATHFVVDVERDRSKKKRQTRRKVGEKDVLFGGQLYLRIGNVSNLYRDIVDLNQFCLEKITTLSTTFPSLVRMALRLLCETAAKEKNMKLDNYLKNNFEKAKSSLTQDTKTTLSTQNISEKSIVQLLHIGAHNYNASSNMEQTIALSIIIGAILTETHGRDE